MSLNLIISPVLVELGPDRFHHFGMPGEAVTLIKDRWWCTFIRRFFPRLPGQMHGLISGSSNGIQQIKNMGAAVSARNTAPYFLLTNLDQCARQPVSSNWLRPAYKFDRV